VKEEAKYSSSVEMPSIVSNRYRESYKGIFTGRKEYHDVKSLFIKRN
jgi:hypothetical protein